jgi:hypothetical protein
MVNPNNGQGQTKGPTKENMQWANQGVSPDNLNCARVLQNFRGALGTASQSNQELGKKHAARLAYIQNVLAVVEPLASSTSLTLAIDKSERTPLFEEDEDGNTEISKIGEDASNIANAVVEQVTTMTDKEGETIVSEDAADKAKLGVSLAIKAVGCGIGIATAVVTGGVSAAIACGPLLVQGVSEIVTYMQNRVQFAPKEPLFVSELQWTKSYMEELQAVETRVASAFDRGAELFKFTAVTISSMRKIMCVIGAMTKYWDTLKLTFSVAAKDQVQMTTLEQDVEKVLEKGVVNLDRAIQLEQMRMIAVLGEDLQKKKSITQEVDQDMEKGELKRLATRHPDLFEDEEDPGGD